MAFAIKTSLNSSRICASPLIRIPGNQRHLGGPEADRKYPNKPDFYDFCAHHESLEREKSSNFLADASR
jgi:hypothetical protein